METADTAVDTGTRDCAEVWGSGCGGHDADTRLTRDCIKAGEGAGGGEQGAVGGGGCSCDAVGPVAPWWLVLLVFLVRRLAPLVLLVPGLAYAVDAQHLHVVDGGDYAALTEADQGKPWSTATWLAFNWGRDLVVLYDNPKGGPLLEAVQTMDLGGSVNLGGYARVGLLIPTYSNVRTPAINDFAEIGDITGYVVLPLTRVDRAHAASFGVYGDIPMGDAEKWLGDSHGGVTLQAAWSFSAGPFEALMNLGPRIQRNELIPGGIWGSRWLYGVGLRAEPAGPVFLTGELFGATPVVPWAPLKWIRPVEAIGTIGGQVGRSAAFSIGGGGGIGRGLGSPSMRVIAMADFRRREPTDRDGDGVLDPVDLCRTEPEDLDGFRDEDGCPELDNDRDGIEDPVDACPDRPETRNGIDDGDGCPDGATRLGIAVEAVEGHVLPETVEVGVGDDVVGMMADEVIFRTVPWGELEVRAAAAGFEPVSLTLTLDRAEQDLVVKLSPVEDPNRPPVLDRPVRFEVGSAELLDTAVLEELVEVMAATPELQLLRIEGHADAVGGPRFNYELSLERAEAVKAWLVEHGVAPDRLQAIGSGEARPGDDGGRRVSFQVLVFE